MPFAPSSFLLLVFFLSFLFSGRTFDPKCSLANEVNDFPWQKYQKGIESDGFSYIQAGEHLPMWMK